MNRERRKEIDAVVREIETITAKLDLIRHRVCQIARDEKPGIAGEAIRRAVAGIESLDLDSITEALDEAKECPSVP